SAFSARTAAPMPPKLLRQGRSRKILFVCGVDGIFWPLGAAEGVVDLAGDVALEAADDLFLGLPLGGAPRRVGLGPRVAGRAGHGDRPQRGVGLPVAAAVEPVAELLAGGGIDRAGAAQRGETGLAADPAGVVAGGDQQGGGDLSGHALLGQELRRRGAREEFL